MIKLLIPDVPLDLLNLGPYNKRVGEIGLLLVARNPGYLVLEEALLTKVMSSPSDFEGRMLVVLGSFSHKRFPTRKSTVMICYLISIARKLSISFTIVAPSLDTLDKRIRDQVEEIEYFV